jgi:hypothetical protein
MNTAAEKLSERSSYAAKENDESLSKMAEPLRGRPWRRRQRRCGHGDDDRILHLCIFFIPVKGEVRR